jgi:four helix bundle protein
MNSYQTLSAWKYSHAALLATFRATDAEYHVRKIALFDQIRRAATSIEANIVEGYALNTPALFRRHLRIAIGSAAEAETLIRAAHELDYLSEKPAVEIQRLLSGAIGSTRGLMRSPSVTANRGRV